MELWRGLQARRPDGRGCVATIGNFDGMHRGHQQLVQRVVALAREMHCPSLLVLFEPHPQEFFSSVAPARLMTLREKLEALKAQGIDRVLCLPFDQRLAQMQAEAFVCELLIAQLGVRHLVVGDDFRFGHQRRGDFSLLQTQTSFAVESSPTVLQGDIRVSSTAVRQALAQQAFVCARQLLGRAYAFEGRVVHGDKNGRRLGFPTANILLRRRSLPLRGVYAVHFDVGGKRYQGVANIGFRPTLNGTQARLETHVFDFDGDLYAQVAHVEPVAHLRDEKKFSGLDALQAQIAMDVRQARDLFATFSAAVAATGNRI